MYEAKLPLLKNKVENIEKVMVEQKKEFTQEGY